MNNIHTHLAAELTPRVQPHRPRGASPAAKWRAGGASGAFTLIELLVVVSIITLLIAILLPALSRAIATARGAVCMSNLRQQSLALAMYLSDHTMTYPDHRTDELGQGTGPQGYDAYWATTLLRYGLTPELFHCPAAGDKMTNHGHTWTWAFDQNNIGYGYNGWFLGIRKYADSTYAGIDTKGYFKFTQTKNPAGNLVIADTAPRGASGMWSQSIWWPNSGTNNDEGVVGRHLPDANGAGLAGTVWADSHAELRREDTINPDGDAGLLDKLNIWDPLQRQH